MGIRICLAKIVLNVKIWVILIFVKWNGFKLKAVNQRKLYRGLLFLFSLALLVQLLIIVPFTVDDKVVSVDTVTSDTKKSESAKAPPSVSQINSELGGDQQMKSIHMLETREGEKDWELWSNEAQSIPETEQVRLQGVNSLFHAKNGVTYAVKGRRGVIDVPKKDLEVSGNVETKTSSGYTFLTDDMRYISKDRILVTDSKVKVLGPKIEKDKALNLTGRGMRTVLNESKVEVLKDVRAEKILEKGQRAIIRSDRARFDGNSVTASFLGEVVLDIDDMRITGPKADFLYDSTKDILKSVVFTGGARVSDPNKWATSDEVKVDFTDNKYIFSGSPRVVQNSDELRGEKIIFHDGGKRIQVIGAKAKLDRNRLNGGE